MTELNREEQSLMASLCGGLNPEADRGYSLAQKQAETRFAKERSN